MAKPGERTVRWELDAQTGKHELLSSSRDDGRQFIRDQLLGAGLITRLADVVAWKRTGVMFQIDDPHHAGDHAASQF